MINCQRNFKSYKYQWNVVLATSESGDEDISLIFIRFKIYLTADYFDSKEGNERVKSKRIF